ncbi:hypothetical protein NP493_405g03011 [Ridgeia piscesae]|uniref:Uncharacterized protein n=1 Tax=Ridgeia piscesae TaxID=27915 RepID=A0AAD9L1B8_RIDPI|nr:hypothetical protein NP493_405g03011 [Ridgeia piscesae]
MWPRLEKLMTVTEKLSENIHMIANEPCLAYFRIQEHVHKTVPQLVEKKHEMNELQQEIQGSCFDTEYAVNAVKGMGRSGRHFNSVQELLKNCMFMKQQITYEQTHSRHQQNQSASNKFRGGMTRTHTVDIPVSGPGDLGSRSEGNSA